MPSSLTRSKARAILASLPVIPVGTTSRRTFASITSDHDIKSNSQPCSTTSTSLTKPIQVDQVRQARSLQALHLKPLKREAEFGIPSCDLQLRSFSVQPLEFFSDFALRAAYYLGLPAYGPIPLPRITERWTVPKSHFIFKKAQENFERVTLRRMIQIRDGNPETVQLWLAYLKKHQFYGVGMKANVWEFSQLGIDLPPDLREKQLGQLGDVWSHLGQVGGLGTPEKVEDLLGSRRSKDAAGSRQPLATNK